MVVLLFPGLEIAGLFAADHLLVLIAIAVAFNVLFWNGAALSISTLQAVESPNLPIPDRFCLGCSRSAPGSKDNLRQIALEDWAGG